MASVLARSKLLVAPNPLAYPAGVAPGFDPTHPASQNAILSAVASGASFVNLTNGVVGTVNGTGVTGVMDSRMGPSVSITGNGNVSFAGTNGGKSTLTMAAIIKLTGTTGQPSYALNDAALGVNGIGYNLTSGNNLLGVVINNSFVANEPASTGSATVLTGSSAVPYFIASSTSGTTTNFVVRRLDNGQVWIGSNTSSSPATGDGSLYIGNRGLNTRFLNGNVCAVLYSTAYLSTQQLLAWAYDPWAYWYPRPAIQYTTTATTTATGGARVRQRWNRSPLAYPAGAAPGFDPGHVAALGGTSNLYSIVIGPSGPIDPVRGIPYTINGTPTVNINGSVGSGANTSTSQSFSNTISSITPTQYTAAAIIYMTSISGNDQNILGTTLNGLFFRQAGPVFAAFPGTVVNSTIFPTINTPYFVAVSWKNGAVVNFVATNLATGVIKTSAVAASGAGGSTSTIIFANNLATGGTKPFQGSFAAGMWCSNYLNMSELVQWAQDPWSFWYPNKTINLTSAASSVGASFLPTWAFDYNTSVLGTGTF